MSSHTLNQQQRELVSLSALTASNTDPLDSHCNPTTGCNVDNLKQTSTNDLNNHITAWKSSPVLNASVCSPVSIISDWSSIGKFTIWDTVILHDGTNTSVHLGDGKNKFYVSKGSVELDVTEYMECIRAQLQDGQTAVDWDICSVRANTPSGTFDNLVGARWELTSTPDLNCVVGIYELQVHGMITPFVWSVGTIIGIVVASAVALVVGAVCVIRQVNLRIRKGSR